MQLCFHPGADREPLDKVWICTSYRALGPAESRHIPIPYTVDRKLYAKVYTRDSPAYEPQLRFINKIPMFYMALVLPYMSFCNMLPIPMYRGDERLRVLTSLNLLL